MFSAMVIILTTVISLISLWVRWRMRNMKLFLNYGIPGPTPNIFTGNLKEYHEKRNRCIQEWTQSYGKIFGVFLGAKPCIICTDLELLEIILVKKFPYFSEAELIIPDGGIPHPLMNRSISVEKADSWKTVRNVISSGLTLRKIKMMSHQMTDPIKTLLNRLEDQKEEPIDVMKFYRKIIMDIIFRSAFGSKTDAQNETDNKFIRSIYRTFDIDTNDFLPKMSMCFPEFEPCPTYLRIFLDQLRYKMNLPSVQNVFDKCRNIINLKRISKNNSEDLVQTMIECEENNAKSNKLFDEDSVLANTVLILFAGQDSITSFLTWCMYYLAQDSTVQEKLRNEIKEKLPDNEYIEYKNLSDLQYLDQVISETFRISPFSINLEVRISKTDFKYKDITIPKGVLIIVPLTLLHKDQNYWTQPSKFDPERFSLENRQKIIPFSYQPFGAGPRSCIGKKFATTIIKLIIANIIRTFEIEPYGEYNQDLKYSVFSVRPTNGVFIKFKKIL